MYKTTHVCGKLQSQHSVKRLAGKIGLKKVLFLSLRVSGGVAEGFKTAACKFVVNTIWKRGRVVDCTGLENQQRATFREFESHRFRQICRKYTTLKRIIFLTHHLTHQLVRRLEI